MSVRKKEKVRKMKKINDEKEENDSPMMYRGGKKSPCEHKV